MFNRYVRAAVELVGPLNGSELVRAEVRRFAISAVVYERAATAWAEAVAQRERGRGRRPSERAVERLARRLGLADQTLEQARSQLHALAAQREGAGLTALARHVHERYGSAAR